MGQMANVYMSQVPRVGNRVKLIKKPRTHIRSEERKKGIVVGAVGVITEDSGTVDGLRYTIQFDKGARKGWFSADELEVMNANGRNGRNGPPPPPVPKPQAMGTESVNGSVPGSFNTAGSSSFRRNIRNESLAADTMMDDIVNHMATPLGPDSGE